MSPDQATNPLLQTWLIPYAIIFAIFYFLIIRPQMNKQKQHKEMLSNVKKNDQIVTSGGIHGTIVNVKETTVILRIDDSVKIEINKEAVSIIKGK